MPFKSLERDYFCHNDVVAIAKDLIGKYLHTQWNGIETIGRIVETEAYCHINDKACHSHNHKKTNRTRVMFEKGGLAYVYLCYGIHHLFNIVTNEEGKADAVLIRAIEPVKNRPVMEERRNLKKAEKATHRLTGGPGMVSKAMGILTDHYGLPLEKSKGIWLTQNTGENTPEISSGPRVGVGYAEKDAMLAWRFWEKDNIYVSRAKH